MHKKESFIRHFSHETRLILGNKFIMVAIILLLYFLFAAWHFGLKDGFLVMLLTWSFFVLATPVPDGGIILDLPLRYFLGLKMMLSEVFVWVFAITLNVVSLFFFPAVYDKTLILTVFKDILLIPFPYGLIIVLSCIGTFFSLYFGDELYDVLTHSDRVKHKKHHMKLKLIILVSLVVFVVIIYELLLKHLGVTFL